MTKQNKVNNKPIYIQSIEASHLYEHMNRGKNIPKNYTGLIPYSLESIKLRKEGLQFTTLKHSGKDVSNDVINVKFTSKVRSVRAKIKEKQKEKDNPGTKEKRKERLDNEIEFLHTKLDQAEWQNEVRVNSLREMLYEDGFTIKTTDKETGEIVSDVKYVVYKRSSSKSRTGQCLFIKESLHKKMIEWSRMYLPFKKDQRVDLAGLLAYESLVGSSLESTVHIHPKHILLVDDKTSEFKKVCNVVKTGKNDFLDSVEQEEIVSNSLFDGESLLASEFFNEGTSMMLLRNHMFKSAAFNCNIQQFLKDHCPKGVEYDQWELENMFGQKMKASDVKFICTPTSLKALKFSKVLGSELELWEHWKKLIVSEGNVWGVVKHEKESKRGKNELDQTLQQTSYQMINCLPIHKQGVEDLLQYEIDYTYGLKNDTEKFIEHIEKKQNDINTNEMMVAVYRRNEQFAQTSLFKDFRKTEIHNHVEYVKRGKVRLPGDYCVLLGNPIEYLYHAIGQEPQRQVLKGNEVHTSMFESEKEVVAFRNPNTSPSNVLVVKNKIVKEIDTYFNLSRNIVCVNAIDFEIQDILSGCDYDSDTMVIFDHPALLEVGKQCFGKYKVCLNRVEGESLPYRLNNLDMCKIDNQLSESQKNIGRVTNIGQNCMSIYWDMISKGETEGRDYLLKRIDVMTVLSGICIDLAKKFYKIDIKKEINHVEKALGLQQRAKPKFWKCVSSNTSNNTEQHECPMDILFDIMSNLKNAERTNGGISVSELLVKAKVKDGDRNQKGKIEDYIEEMCNKINKAYKYMVENDKDSEEYLIIDDAFRFYKFKMQKLKVKPPTMYSILRKIDKSKEKKRFMKVLFDTQQDTFLNAFKQKNTLLNTNSPKTA
ncbi:hypothetical protein [Bacillus pumilus]|uniref:hypothetical protein n=1 Tax=Bacillus pumilus TaxID=1408 RepID=UPI002ABE1B0E|nr:hypothetical protein [Bacillus pumilus]